MKDSTKRTVRTTVQVVAGLLAALPVLLAFAGSALHLAPIAASAGTVVAVAAVVTKGWNRAEEAGLIPAWLKSAADAGTTEGYDVTKLIDPETQGA